MLMGLNMLQKLIKKMSGKIEGQTVLVLRGWFCGGGGMNNKSMCTTTTEICNGRNGQAM